MKKIISVLFALFLLSTLVLPSFAADLYLIDNGNLLTEEEAGRVDSRLREVSEEIGMDVLIRTASSLGGKSAMAYADDAMDYEYGQVEDGILLLLSMDEREWYVSTKGRGISSFDDSGIDWMMDQVLGEIKRGDYEEAFLKFAQAAKEYSEEDHFFSKDLDSQWNDYSYSSGKRGFHFSVIGFAVCFAFGLGISFVIVLGMKSQLKSARFQNANPYLLPGSFRLTQNVDLFLYKNVTRVKIESTSSSGGGGGVHTSSSGSSHGGHGGKF